MKTRLVGGLDVAVRVDNTALVSLELRSDWVLEEHAILVFPHIHPEKIGRTLSAIQKEDPHIAIGYDRLGTGEMVQLFPNNVRHVMEEVVSTMNMKQDIIGLLRKLFDDKKLIIYDERLYTEIAEQEKHISDAGNILYRHPSGFHDDRFWALGYAALTAVKYMKQGSYARVAIATPPKTMEGIITEDMINNI